MLQAKHVYRVAVGFGPKAKKMKTTLQEIAGAGNPVLMVTDYSKLQGMIEKIKASACAGTFT